MTTDPVTRLCNHLRTCLYCKSTPAGSRPVCGQRLSLEADLDPALLTIIRAGRSGKPPRATSPGSNRAP